MDYRSRPVFDFRPTFDRIDHGLLDDHSYDAPTGGVAVPWKVTSVPKRTLALPFLLEGLREIKFFRAFMAAREGRRTGFWVPTWLTDFEITEDTNGTTDLPVKWIGLGPKLTFGAQFRHVALITWDKLEIYRVESTAVSGNVETLTLDRLLDTPAVASQTVCCGVLFARLADDDIDYEYVSGAVARVDLKFVELPTETEGTMHEGSKPAFLYVIQRGAVVWRFTNWPIDLLIGADNFNAQAIEHDAIEENVDFTNDPISLTCATDAATHPLRAFLDPANVEETTIDIYEVDVEALPGVLPAATYSGRIERAQPTGKGRWKAAISSLMRIAEEDIPQALMERTCVLRTYDEYSGLNPVDWRTSGPVTAISFSPPYVEAVEFGAKATAEADPNWFALGLVQIGTEKRLCTGQDGDRLYLNVPFRNAIVGNTVDAYAGDDKRIETWDTKFSNAENCLAFPYIPNRNPQFEALVTPKPEGGKK
jgi:hypothetical protein